jgi:hypothetical protein
MLYQAFFHLKISINARVFYVLAQKRLRKSSYDCIILIW